MAEKHKYYISIYQYQRDHQKSTSTVNAYINTKAFHTDLTTHNMITHRHLHTYTHTHPYPPPLHTHTHTELKKRQQQALLVVACFPAPHPLPMVLISESEVKAARMRCILRLGLKDDRERCRESSLYRNGVPHTKRLVLKRPCTGGFQVNTWDRERFVRRWSKGSAGSVRGDRGHTQTVPNNPAPHTRPSACQIV